MLQLQAEKSKKGEGPKLDIGTEVEADSSSMIIGNEKVTADTPAPTPAPAPDKPNGGMPSQAQFAAAVAIEVQKALSAAGIGQAEKIYDKAFIGGRIAGDDEIVKISDHFYSERQDKVLPYTQILAKGWRTNGLIPCAPNGGCYFQKSELWTPSPLTGVVRHPLPWRANADVHKLKLTLCDRFGTAVQRFAKELPLGFNTTGNDPFSVWPSKNIAGLKNQKALDAHEADKAAYEAAKAAYEAAKAA